VASLGTPMPAVAGGRRQLNAASAAGTRVNRDADSLLRLALPINCPEARELQSAVEDIKGDVRVRRFLSAETDVERGLTVIKQKGKALVKAVRADTRDRAQELLVSLETGLDTVRRELGVDAFQGSVQDQDKINNVLAAQRKLSDDLTELQELMVPTGYTVEVPDDFQDLPRLNGRAKVAFTYAKGSPGDKFDVDGVLRDRITVTMVLDGFTAPITAGNILDLVKRGWYNGLTITRSDGFVVQAGDKDPEGTVHGYVPAGKTEERKVPLEIFVKGDTAPMYSMTIEEDQRGYAPTVLPFQAYGAIGMARSEFENDSASSQIFWLLFESDLTPAGKNMLDGRYACAGMAVDNAELLRLVSEGDKIVEAKVLSGAENLKNA